MRSNDASAIRVFTIMVITIHRVPRVATKQVATAKSNNPITEETTR